jgi:hypothetical protein
MVEVKKKIIESGRLNDILKEIRRTYRSEYKSLFEMYERLKYDENLINLINKHYERF